MNLPRNDFDRLVEGYDLWMLAVTRPDEYQNIAGFLPAHTESILDVGCGTGRLSLYLADYARQVTGIDSAATMIQLAAKNQREQLKLNVTFIHAAVESWDSHGQQFDFIVGDKALHHTDLDAILPKLRALLRPGGRIWVRDIATEDIARWRSPVWQYRQALRELRELKGRGWQVMWRLARFRLNPAWIKHICHDNILSSQQTMAIYRRHFPGCLAINPGEQVMVLWENSTEECHP
jgi:ubiquinone/menaquinone biosynthesis C-methylase UbiE